jgi:hypothetical protein
MQKLTLPETIMSGMLLGLQLYHILHTPYLKAVDISAHPAQVLCELLNLRGLHANSYFIAVKLEIAK